MTSSPSVADLKGNIFGRIIYPPSLIVIASIDAKLWRRGKGGGILPPPPPPSRSEKTKRKKEASLSRVKGCKIYANTRFPPHILHGIPTHNSI